MMISLEVGQSDCGFIADAPSVANAFRAEHHFLQIALVWSLRQVY